MLAMTFGAIEVGYPSFGRAAGADAWGPALLALCSLGSATGGLVFGGLHVRAPHARQLAVATACLAAGLAVHVPITSPWALAFAALAAGALIAPALILVSVLVSDLAPPHYATEAFTWSATAIVTGLGTGTAVAGTLIERYGTASAFACASGSALLAAGFASALARRR
jgi:predicted MFS family arabinose efflux permease